ncbi:MAG: YbaY family lipoprotein [Gammaproteobacteria bacterium]
MLRFSKTLRGFTLLFFCLLASEGQASEQVQGTATYRERLALPVDAVFEATLEDVSKADASAEAIGRARIERPGNPPIRFEITYDPARIDPSHRYAVRARILVRGKLFFITDRSYPVLTGGYGNEVALLLRRASASGSAGGGAGSLGRLPATFAGDLPCADCPGIRHQLELFPDEIFFLRMTYLGKGDDASFDDIGTWTVASDRRTLVLFGGRDAPLKFAIKDVDTLRQLDLEGRDIDSAHNHDLKRTEDLQPLDPRLLMRGMYKYFADAGRFTECFTRKSWPVAQEQDNAALESAYSKAYREPGEELLVNLEGQVAMRPKMEGEGQQPTLVVERFIGVWPGESCGSRYSTETLENTYWKLTRLGDAPVAMIPQQREPHIILNSESRRVSGSGGCNRLMGSYELNGDRLTFGQMASTRMACPKGMDTEKAFLEALTQVNTLKITRQHLELFDAAGNQVARFGARHMK